MTWLLVPLYPKLFVEAQSDCAWAMASRPSVPANATTPEELPCSPCHKVGWDKRSLHLIMAARPLMGSVWPTLVFRELTRTEAMCVTILVKSSGKCLGLNGVDAGIPIICAST